MLSFQFYNFNHNHIENRHVAALKAGIHLDAACCVIYVCLALYINTFSYIVNTFCQGAMARDVP